MNYEVPSDDRTLADLYKSMTRERPIPTRHIVDWDIRLVLAYFQSPKFADWQSLSDKELTLKTVFLLALASGKRRSELHALSKDIRWIKGSERGMELKPVPSFVSKTQLASQGLGSLRPFIIPALDQIAGDDDQERLLCPIRCMKYYLKRIEAYRSIEQKRLIISYRRGMVKDITKQSISCYIKEAILLAYQGSDNALVEGLPLIKAHSIRHVATSLNALKFYSLDDVLKAGAWTSPNVFLSHYVQDFSVEALTNLSRLNFVVAGSKF